MLCVLSANNVAMPCGHGREAALDPLLPGLAYERFRSSDLVCYGYLPRFNECRLRYRYSDPARSPVWVDSRGSIGPIERESAHSGLANGLPLTVTELSFVRPLSDGKVCPEADLPSRWLVISPDENCPVGGTIGCRKNRD